MPSLIQKHAHVKGQRSNHHIFKFQPNPSWAKKRPNGYTTFVCFFREWPLKTGFTVLGAFCALVCNHLAEIERERERQTDRQRGLRVCVFLCLILVA